MLEVIIIEFPHLYPPGSLETTSSFNISAQHWVKQSKASMKAAILSVKYQTCTNMLLTPFVTAAGGLTFQPPST